jgi:hypothetical protein
MVKPSHLKKNHQWGSSGNTTWSQSLWFTSLHPWCSITNWINWTWQVVELMLTRCVHQLLATPCKQHDTCLQSEDATGITAIPHGTRCEFWHCPHWWVESRCSGWSRCHIWQIIRLISLATFQHLFQLWYTRNKSPLIRSQLGSCFQASPSCQSTQTWSPTAERHFRQMRPWLPIYLQKCNLWGRTKQDVQVASRHMLLTAHLQWW